MLDEILRGWRGSQFCHQEVKVGHMSHLFCASTTFHPIERPTQQRLHSCRIFIRHIRHPRGRQWTNMQSL